MSEAGSIGASSGNRRAWSSVIEQRTIVVKAGTTPSAARVHVPAPGTGPVEMQPMHGRIQFLNSQPAPGTRSARSGWDPGRPWSDEDARGRASRYWPLGWDQVSGWLETPASCPVHLLLAVDGAEGATVRYAWQIDTQGCWEFYADDDRWGVPLGDPVPEHPALGLVLVETRNGTEQHVLDGYASGVRVLDPN